MTLICYGLHDRGKTHRHSARITIQSSNPIEGEESDNTSDGHETSFTDEETPLINKNIRGMASPVLRAIDDDISLTTRSLKSSFSPHTRPGKHSVFMVGGTSAPVNAEEQAKGENPVENIQVWLNSKMTELTRTLFSCNFS